MVPKGAAAVRAMARALSVWRRGPVERGGRIRWIPLRYDAGQNDSTGVYDRIHWGFVKYMWSFRRAMGPRVRRLILEHGSHADVRIVRSRHAAGRLVDDIIRCENAGNR